MGVSLSKLREMVKDREAWHAAVHGVTKSCWAWLSMNNKPLNDMLEDGVYSSLLKGSSILFVDTHIHTYICVYCMHVYAIPFSRDFPNPGIEPGSPTLQADSLPSEPPGSPVLYYTNYVCII